MKDILVLGAGMVGVCTAMELQSRGHLVTLVDKAEPGCATSHGNAGIIQAEAAEPYALPRRSIDLLKIMLGRTNDVTWSFGGVMSMAKPLLQYFKHSATHKHADISRCYSQLTRHATDDHAALFTASNAENLLSRNGLCEVYRSQHQLDHRAEELVRLKQEYGLASRVLDANQYTKEEPAIKGYIAGAVHWPQSWSCSDPRALTQKYADTFKTRGGCIELLDVKSLQRIGSSWNLKSRSDQTLIAEDIVVCLGPWSPELLQPLGYRIPMIFKRGYHAHYNSATPVLRPFIDIKSGVVAACVSQGLRITTGVSLVKPNAPAHTIQLDRGTQGISEIINLGSRIEEPAWFGTRPCLPDMLPLVGAAPNHANLWFNFGHGHQGFTLGPTTAQYLADAIDGSQSTIGAALSPDGRIS